MTASYIPDSRSTDSILQRIFAVLAYPAWFDRVQNRLRGTVAVESGTVTTVGTVTNVSQVGLLDASALGRIMTLEAWTIQVRSRIS